MQIGKSQGSQRPTAMGTLLQSSCYGAAIPVIYGLTQSAPLAIWAANLRQGGSNKKFKQMKKGITSYIEAIDFLLGHNPILGVLQMWNNGSPIPLTYTQVSVTATAGRGSYAVSDPHYYAVVGVTLTASYSVTFDDYGSQGPNPQSGSYEIPLWNELFTGPDPTNPMSYRCWPYCYRWQPGLGATVYIDAELFPGGTLNIYYAQMMDADGYRPPIQFERLAFEPVLGSGTEYDGYAGNLSLLTQQIQYPHFAGMGSNDIDLGASGTIPSLQAEVQGKWGVYPTGDADFVDIIEDIVKSGFAQAAVSGDIPNTQMEHGLSGYHYPGTIQKKADSSTTVALPPMLYDLQNASGNFLVCVATGAGTLGISSSAGDAWVAVYGDGLGYQVWYAVAVGGPNTVTVSGASAPWAMSIMEIGGVGLPGPVPSTPPSPGTVTVYPTSAPVTVTGTGAGSATDTTADLTVTGTVAPVSTADRGTAEVVYGGFSLQLPAGAVVSSMTAVVDIASNLSQCGFISNFPFSGGVTPTNPNGTYSSSLAFDSSNPQGTIAAISYSFEIGYSLDGAIFADSCTISNIYIVVAYSVPNGTGGLGGSPVDAIDTVTVGHASVQSTVEQGLPGYLLNIALYTGANAPAAADIPKWGAVTHSNESANWPSTFSIVDRIIHAPGTYKSAPATVAPTSTCMLAFKPVTLPSYPEPAGDFLDRPSLDLTRQQCRAAGLWGSLTMTAQQAASDWLKMLFQAANATPVFMGFKLYSFPLSEVSAIGNGATYTAPTASGPVANLSTENGDFVCAEGESPIKIDRKARVDLPNVVQMQHINRNSNYAQVLTVQPEVSSIALYGVRKAAALVNNAVQDVGVARKLLGVQARQLAYAPDQYTFTLNAKWFLLAPMDLITVTDPELGLEEFPLRLLSIEEDASCQLACTAEPFFYGMCAPTPYAFTNPSPNVNSTGTTAGNVNAPVIFEPQPREYGSAPQAQLWLAVSSSSPEYGGCQVYISTDGGNSYNLAGVIPGNAVTGVTTADWPAAADPDTVNNLSLDLSESLGTLLSYQASDRDNFLYPCYVAGGGGSAIPYELMTYNSATLTSANKYTLNATGTGNELRRAVFGAPAVGEGCDHPSGSRFAFLSPAGTGLLKLEMDPAWIGVTLYFKFPTFNTFGGAAQSLTGLTAYPFTPTGVASGSASGGGFLVNGS